jgi:hypothetical protein
MWNSTKYTVMAIGAAGLAVVASSPASAQYAMASGDYTYNVHGPNPWNQGAAGGPWLRAPWWGAAQAAVIPAQPQAVVVGGYGCSTVRPVPGPGCGGPQRGVVWPHRISAVARRAAAG